MRFRLSILSLLCAASASSAVTFAPVKNYPNIGFLFPCLADAKANPVPMPLAHSYLFTDDEAIEREDRFAPRELWYNLQCCARWQDPQANLLVLGRITHRLPLFASEYVSRERFNNGLDDDNRIDPKNQEHINEWVAAFTETVVSEPEPLKINGFSLEDVMYYPCSASNRLVYAFRPRRIGNAKNFDWFCVTLDAPRETDPVALRDLFEERFIAQIALPSRSSKTEGAVAQEVFTQRKGQRLPDRPDHPVRVEARKSVENYDDWWFAETDGHIILSDVDTEVGKALIRELQDTLPALRLAHTKLVPPLTRETDIALIRLFQKRSDYVDYVGPAHAWSGGMWMPGRRELVVFEQENHAVMLRFIRHELFHQYLSHAYCMLDAAPWVNEGHACLFENAAVSPKGRVTLEEDPDRCALLLENLEAAVEFLPQLLLASYETFYDDAPATRLRFKYALVWGLAYYLQKGAPLERNTPFKNILPDYAEALALTHDGQAATAAAFKKIDLAVFKDNFREFWLKRRGSAMRYDPLEP